jgi:hypothetical protein
MCRARARTQQEATGLTAERGGARGQVPRQKSVGGPIRTGCGEVPRGHPAAAIYCATERKLRETTGNGQGRLPEHIPGVRQTWEARGEVPPGHSGAYSRWRGSRNTPETRGAARGHAYRAKEAR